MAGAEHRAELSARQLPQTHNIIDTQRTTRQWSGFSDTWLLGYRRIYAIVLVRGRTNPYASALRNPFAMVRWGLFSYGPAFLAIAGSLTTANPDWRLTGSDIALLFLLGTCNAGMFAAASLAWGFPLTRTAGIDDLIRGCPDRDSIVSVIERAYGWTRQPLLPLACAAVPVVLAAQSGSRVTFSSAWVLVTIAWTMFLLGNVSYWLVVPPLLVIRMRSCRELALRWNDPARTPGIRTLSEGYAYPAVFLALGALAVTGPGLLGNSPLLGNFQPYLYGTLLVLSLWVGAVTQVFIFAIVRRFRLRIMDTLTAHEDYLMSEDQSPEILTRVSQSPNATITLSAYNSVAGAPGLPYGTGLVVQYLAAIIGSVVGFLLQ